MRPKKHKPIPAADRRTSPPRVGADALEESAITFTSDADAAPGDMLPALAGLLLSMVDNEENGRAGRGIRREGSTPWPGTAS